MKMIQLPNNGFGWALGLTLIILSFVTPFAATYWLLSMAAPWWVCLPFSLLTGIVAFILAVRFK